MTKELASNTIAALLDEGKGADIIGTLETQTVDFKAEPYRLDDDIQKQELSKDVAAFANAKGGIIVLGIRTEKSATHPADIAAELRPFPISMVDPQRYLDTISARVFPPPENVSVRLVQEPGNTGKAFGMIQLPPQPDSKGPFLVPRLPATPDRTDGILIGVFERRSASSEPLSVHEVQSLLRDGRLFRRAIDLRAGTPSAPPKAEPTRALPVENLKEVKERTINKAESLVDEVHLGEMPTFVLTATPLPYLDATRMFASEDDSIVKALRHPLELREMGFDLYTGDYPRIIDGELRRAVYEEYKGLDFWRDGVLVFVASGDNEFLAWGERRPEDPLRVNPVPLIEAILLFCSLAQHLFSLCPTPPERVLYVAHFRRMCISGKPPLLMPGEPHPARIATPKPARGCEKTVEVELPYTTPAEKAAYHLVREVYTWFGHVYESIPYVEDEAIDSKAIGKL